MPDHRRYVVVRCPHCCSEVQVRRSKLEQQARCPYCFRDFNPRYELEDESDVPQPVEDDSQWQAKYERFEQQHCAGTCPRCSTRVFAPIDQAGTEKPCPECGTPTRLVKPEPRTTTESSIDEQSPGDAYPLLADDDVHTEKRVPVIHFECPVCHSHLAAEQHQVGQQVRCIECDTNVIVPAQSLPASHGGSPSDTGDIETIPLAEDTATEGVSPAPKAAMIPVWCRLCGELYWADRAQVGQRLKCPECGTDTLITPRETSQPPEIEAEPYEVGKAEEAIEREDLREAVEHIKEAAQQRVSIRDEPEFWAVTKQCVLAMLSWRCLILHMLAGGTWRVVGWPCFVGMLVSLLLSVLILLANALQHAIVILMLLLIGIVLSGFIGTLYLAILADIVLTIIETYSEGTKPDMDTYELNFPPSFYPITYFVLPLAVCQTLAYVLARGVFDWPLYPTSLLVTWLLFPVLLLSALCGKTPFDLVSFVAVRGIFFNPLAWLVFYLQSAVLGGAFFAVYWLLGKLGLWATVLATPLTLSAACIIYAELLGYLARCSLVVPFRLEATRD